MKEEEKRKKKKERRKKKKPTKKTMPNPENHLLGKLQVQHSDVNLGSGLFSSSELETAGKSCAIQYLILQCLVAT